MSLVPKKASSRILALDLMRGYFLVCLIIDHLHYWPNGLSWLSMRGELFVSAAEGFFLISGIVLGIVRGSKLIDKPFKLPAWLLVKRGLQLYVTYALLTIFFTLFGWAFFMNNPGLKDGIAASGTSVITMIWQVISFQYLYGWADYLRLYALFLFVSPLIMWLLRTHRWNVALAASIAVWAFSPNLHYPDSIFIQPLKWQLLFFGGMIIGFHWQQLQHAWQKIPVAWRRVTIGTAVSVSLITLVWNVFLAYGGAINQQMYDIVAPLRAALQSQHFDKELLPPARLALMMLWFWSGFWFVRRFERQIIRLFGWILVPFGTNSLYVYIVHAFILFFIHLVVPPGNKVLFTNVVLTWGTLAVIWTLVRYQVLFKVIPR